MKTKLMAMFLVAAMAAMCGSALADWQRSPASDVDKEFISGNDGLVAGVVPPIDNSCWMATASNLLAGAGYGNGSTFQERAEDIYIDMLIWQFGLDPTNIHGTEDGGWIDTAATWWLGSANNIWPANPYTVVTVYGNKTKVPWANANGARYIGNQLREYQQVGLSISWPRTTAGGSPGGGHAITAWGDDGTLATLTTNPGEVIVADSDRDTGSTDFQTYTYDNYTNPNPSGFNEGNGWYFNFSANHWFIKHIATLCPTDSPVDPADGPTQKCVGSYKIHQDDLESATDLHYTAWTDYDILGYHTEIDWTTANDPPGINESNTHVPSLTRSDIEVDWDLSDNPVPYCTDVTITTEFILQGWNGVWYDDVYFTYLDEDTTKFNQPPDKNTGVDIRVDNKDGTNRLLADDFQCVQTGPITKIYLWGSWLNDYGRGAAPGDVEKFHLFIYSDDPVGDDPANPDDDPTNQVSKPLELLWSGDFDQFETTEYSFVQEEGFWDPYSNDSVGWDNRIWQYVIDIPESSAFAQEGSSKKPKVYWLGVSAEISGQEQPQFGWKTTDSEHSWNDAAVAWKDIFVKTDEFDFWEDQASHSYAVKGSTSQGAYDCSSDYSLRLGNCDRDSYVNITVSVSPGTDQVKLRYKIPHAGYVGRSTATGATLYVDGIARGNLVDDGCNWQELVLSMGKETADGQLEIKIADEVDGCDGDIQITYMEVYSLEQDWSPLYYQSYAKDMSFGIVTPTTAPGSYLPEFGWNIVTPELADTNIVDITGGYVVGAFDIIDMAQGAALLGRYRFVHQYPYTQDPEQHIFTIQGPEDQTGCEYVATNFRFGHLYGMPDNDELWKFSDWMTVSSDQQVYLCDTKPSRIVLDWEGRLPYPKSNITPADELPDPPDDNATVYLVADPTSVTLKTAGDADTVTISGGSAPYTIQTAPDAAIATAGLSGAVLTVTAVADGTTSVVIADGQVPADPVTIPITVGAGGAAQEPPTQTHVDLCDAACQATAPVTATGVDFSYTEDVTILVGAMDATFTQVWWLNSSCEYTHDFAEAASGEMTLSCSEGAPANAAWLFWFVTAEDLNTLDWDNGAYELLFYKLNP